MLHLNKQKLTRNGLNSMTKNLWQQERRQLFRELVKQYADEGYDQKESKRLAKMEINDIMEDKENFVNNLWRETFRDVQMETHIKQGNGKGRSGNLSYKEGGRESY